MQGPNTATLTRVHEDYVDGFAFGEGRGISPPLVQGQVAEGKTLRVRFTGCVWEGLGREVGGHVHLGNNKQHR